jgi:hypothetical protein
VTRVEATQARAGVDALVWCLNYEEGSMPSKSPQKPSAKKAGKTLKEKREAKREKKDKRPPLS